MGCVNSQIKNAKVDSASIQKEEDPVCQALRNDLVLENLSSFLSFSDLANFRLVNQTWNRASLPAIRQETGCLNLSDVVEVIRRQLILEGNPEEANELNFKIFIESRQLHIRGIKYSRKLIDLIKNSSQGFPCTKFCIGILTNNHYYDPDLFKEFLVAISGFATELTLLCGDTFEWKGELSLQFPNLRKLKVVQFGDEEDVETLDFLRYIIMQNAPMLNTLNLTKRSETEDFGSLVELLDVPYAGKIKNLVVQGLLSDDTFGEMTSSGLKLESLQLVIENESEFGPESLHSFLESQCNSLKKLTIGCTHFIEGPMITFPCMKNVTMLKIGPNDNAFSELCFAKQFPWLNHLNMAAVLSELDNFFNSSMPPLATVETLELPELLDEPELIQEAVRMFPNVRKIRASALTASVPVFGQVMKNIQELTICDGVGDCCEERENMNEVFTGYSEEEGEAIQKGWEERGEIEVEELKEPMPFLHGLKVLRIEYFVSDWVYLLGIQRLKSLRCLDLREAETDQERISDQVVELLREKCDVLLSSKRMPTTKVEEKEVTDLKSDAKTKKSKNSSRFVFDLINLF